MQFLILAYDATDADALNRRMANREAHLTVIDSYKQSGNMHMGAAILDDNEKMIGSCIIGDFFSRAELDEWLEHEPYIVGKVWDRVEIRPCKVSPVFLKKS